MADLQYPDDLNPFGSDEEEESQQEQPQQPLGGQPTAEIDKYPDHLSPFADEEEENNTQNHSNDDNYDNSLNPFAEEDEESTRSSPIPPQPEPVEAPPVPLPRTKSLLKKELALRNKQNGSTEPPSDLPKVPLRSSRSNSSKGMIHARSTDKVI